MEDSQLIIGSASDPGTVRDRNEDLVFHTEIVLPDEDPPIAVLAVADGMGGYDRGDVASRIAIDTLGERFSDVDTADIVLMLKQAYRRANQIIFEDGAADGEQNMMGTTLVTAVVRGMELTVANVGDSRAYLCRAGGMTQVTEDHSLIAEQVRMGVLSQEEARGSQHKNIITRALGHRQRVEVDVFELTLLPEDRMLMSTDGVHDVLSEDDLRRIVLSMPPDEAARTLVQQAIAEGSTDNATALVLWVAPVSALTTPVEELRQPVAAGASWLVPVVVGLGLLIVLVIVAVVFLLG